MSNKLILGILRCDRGVSGRWQSALDALQAPDGLEVERVVITSDGQDKFGEIDRARNALVERALEQQARYLFFLDDDVLCPPETLQRLASELAERPQARICSALYPQRIVSAVDERRMMVWKGDYEVADSQWIEDWEPGSVFPCSYLPAGALMIDCRVFAELEKPYFETVYIRRRAAVPDGFIAKRVGEDFHFCHKVAKAGYEVWAAAIICEHETPPKKYLFAEYRMSEL